jgi:hypothetical protein
MLKVSTFLAEDEHGPNVVPLFGPADEVFEKHASVGLLPEVMQYISALRPRNDSQYVLVNALGAGEFYGSNINGDHFPEAALIHRPDAWSGNPLIDKPAAAGWPYGFPTFYNAHPYAHHRNKDPSRAYGEVELATWNDSMKRVELVVRVDLEKCQKFGGVAVWDKVKDGQFPDVSMGSKVPYDTCCICLDWNAYNQALQNFNPKKHKHPGMAVLEHHKKLKAKNGVGIRGLSVTRKDYCEHTKGSMNKILPDGRKIFVYNDFPRFFDISFVFIGADRTAKTLLTIVRAGRSFSMPSALMAENMGTQDPDPGVKVASVRDEILSNAFDKDASQKKQSAIEKEIVPSQFAGKAIPVLTRNEPDIPEEILEAMSAVPLGKALSTSAGLGMVLRPREFQTLLSKSGDPTEAKLSPDDFMPALARLLLPMMLMRSALGPFIERRVVMVCSNPKPQEETSPSSHSSELLRKIGSAYSGYRQSVMDLAPNTQDLIEKAASSQEPDLLKLAEASAEEVFTPLSFNYLQDAFMDEMPVGDSSTQVVKTSSQAHAGVQRGLPSRNTWK